MKQIKYIMVIVMILSLMIVSGCNTQIEDENLNQHETITETEQENYPINEIEEETENPVTSITGNVVAVINEREITQKEIQETQQVFMQQGQQLTEEETLEQIINDIVLVQEVEEKQPMVSTEEAELVIESQLSQQGADLETYKQQLEAQGMDYGAELENFKVQIRTQNYLNKFFENKEINITEEETEEFYEMYKQQSPEEIQPYEELEAQIIMTLEQQKQQELIAELVQELRENADIEYK